MFEEREKDADYRSGTGGEIIEIETLLGELTQGKKDAELAKHRTATGRSEKEDM